MRQRIKRLVIEVLKYASLRLRDYRNSNYFDIKGFMKLCWEEKRKSGSGCWVRTSDQVINSHLLYRYDRL